LHPHTFSEKDRCFGKADVVVVCDLIAVAFTMAAATRLPLLPTVLIGVGSAGIARSVFGLA
jgi:uncharacterized membrane protein